MFLRERKVQGNEINPKYVSADSVSSIKRIEGAYKGTTGNEALDIAFNTAIKLSKEIEAGNRKNELAELDLKARQNVKEYEAKWAGKNKYSSDMYEEYRRGLDDVYSANKRLYEGTKYITKEDVDSWEVEIQRNHTDKLFLEEGKKAEYDTKEYTDRTLLNVQGLMDVATYSNSQSESQNSLSKAFGLLETLSPYMSETEILEMKVNSLKKYSEKRLANQLSDVMNSNMSYEQKLQVIEGVKKGASNLASYGGVVGFLHKNNLINSKDTEIVLNSLKSSTEESINKVNGIAQRMKNTINNQKYVEEYKRKQAEERLQKQFVNAQKSDDSNIDNGNDDKVISNHESEYYDTNSIINSESLTTKYYGKTPSEIVDNDEYIPVDSSELSQLKAEATNLRANGASETEVVAKINESLEAYGDDEIAKKNYKNNLLAKGILKPESQLYGKDNETLNNIAASKGNSYGNINASGMEKRGGLREKYSNLTPYQQALVSKAIDGAVSSGNLEWQEGVKVDSYSVSRMYARNKEFKEYVDRAIKNISEINPARVTRAKINRELLTNQNEQKYGSKEISVGRGKGKKKITVERKTNLDENKKKENKEKEKTQVTSFEDINDSIF